MNSNKLLYKKWINIRQKCNNPKDDNFIYYGGKGIIVCEEWDSFENFKNWALNNGYKEGLVLSRKTANDDYSPETCEWVTDLQHRAKRGNIGKVLTTTYNEIEITLSELSRIVGINRETLKSRYLQGCRDLELIRKPNHGLKVAI